MRRFDGTFRVIENEVYEGEGVADHADHRLPLFLGLRLRQVTVVHRPFAQVREELRAGADTWFPVVAYTANRSGLHWLSQIGVNIWGRQRIRKIDANLVGPVQSEDSSAIFEFSWRDGNIKNPFLDGEIQVAAINAEETHMAVCATYAPNLVLRTGVDDRATLLRIAELTLRDFAERLARQLEGRSHLRDSRTETAPRSLHPG